MHKFNTVRAQTDKKRNQKWRWEAAIMAVASKVRKGEHIDSTKSKVYAANAARHCAKF